jgi:hypothetical protein
MMHITIADGLESLAAHDFRKKCLLTLSILCASLAVPLRLESQTPGLSDTVVVGMVSPALFGLLDYEMTRAALGHRHVVEVEVPTGPLWSRITAQILVAINGRAPTSIDSVVTVVGIKDIHFVADSLTAIVYKETRFRCPDRWMRSGTDYEVRTIRVGGGWTQIVVTPGVTWDSFGCPHGA